jgi:5'-nucleotidase
MSWKLALVGVLIAVLFWAGGLWTTQEPQFEFTILHTNDVHSHYASPAASAPSELGGSARLATLIGAARKTAAHSLLLDAGDESQGSLLFTVGGADVVAAVMNALGYDAMAVGNHEFDEGTAELAHFIDLAKFSVLSANVDGTADAALDGAIRPFDVFLFDGEVVGVFGLTTETTTTASSPGNDVVFEPAVRRAQSVVAMLERQGVNKIVAVTHLGYSEDLQLAAAIGGIDVIVGGHSHTQLGAELPYPTWVTSATGEPVAVVTDGEWGQMLGRLDVVFDSAGRVTSATGELVPADASVTEDPRVVAVLAPYVAEAAALIGEPLGVSDVTLDGDRAHVRSEETNLGNAIADAMLAKAATLGARVALMNGGGIRSSIPQGPVTMGQVLEVLPFKNEITVVTVSGRELDQALENGVSQVEAGGGRFPQVAGLRFSFDPDAPAGERIQLVELRDPASGGYRPLLAEETVIVATNDFLAGGGDGYSSLAGAAGRYDTGWLLSDAFAEFVQEASPLRAEVEGRIRRAST